MTPAVLVSVDEYLRTSYDPDMDFVEGALEVRNVGEFDHSDMQTEIAHWVRLHGRRLGLNAFTELRTKIGPRRYRVPDVVILQGKRPRTRILETAPAVAIEILSPEDRMNRIRERINDYLSAGTPLVWLIDPAARRAWAYTAQGETEIHDGVLRCESPRFSIPLAELFANIDERCE